MYSHKIILSIVLSFLLSFSLISPAHLSYAADEYSNDNSQVHSIVIKRDKNGKIIRSTKARHDFMKQQPCPSTGETSGRCPGYVIDHIIPLKRGGTDAPSNMQWQTVEAAREKDKYE